MRQDRLHLRCEQDAIGILIDVERLLSGSIARQRHRPPPRIPDRQREHAVQLVDRAIAELFVEVNDHFRVGVRSKLMAAFDEARPQIAVVVDLAVEHQLHAAVFVANRLVGCRRRSMMLRRLKPESDLHRRPT